MYSIASDLLSSSSAIKSISSGLIKTKLVESGEISVSFFSSSLNGVFIKDSCKAPCSSK